ncbi:murein biosynthesis integral membrane protein MurJ [Brachybacterium sp. AOP43-C2-M15]|uniref:murein biosynthesis integral membrane protein MurJ n=1 Tax=Brachybacterium sp. AOP43-C2-M15 TaxID=3457661 RepID=UPI004033C2C4
MTPAASRPSRAPASRGGGIARSVLRGAGVILVVTVFARIAGFVRYLVFGASVGAGDVGTAYTTANMLPNVLFEVVAGGMLAAVVVPLIAGLVPEGDPEDRGGAGAALDPRTVEDLRAEERQRQPASGAALADRIVSTLLSWTLLATCLLALLVILLSGPLAQLLLAAETQEAAGVPLGATLLRIFALQLPFYGASVVLAAYLQARKRFLWPAMMPLLSSVVVMVSYRVYAHLVPSVATATTIDQSAVWWLGWGTTAGVVAMTIPVAVTALRAGLRLRPAWSMPAGYGRRALALGGAGLGAVGAQQAVLALVLLLAMRAGGVGTLPVFQYAQALYLLPYAVLVVPLVTSVFPHLSELRLVGDRTGFAKIAAASVRTVMVVSVVGAAMLLAAGPALEQFFRQIDRSGATGVGSTTAGLALGLVGFAVATQCTRILSAALRARDALLVGSVGWLIAGVVILVLVLPSPERSAAEASTAFGLAMALGMAIAGLVGLSRIADVLDHGGHRSAVRRTAILVPLALLGGGVPGLLLGRYLVTTATGEVGSVLIGIVCGLAAAVLSTAVMAAADPEITRRILRRLRAGRHGVVSSGS